MAIELTTATDQQLKDIQEYTSIPILFQVFPEISVYEFNGDVRITYSPTGQIGSTHDGSLGTIVDFKPIQKARLVYISAPNESFRASSAITTMLNANLLTNLEDRGTTASFEFSGYQAIPSNPFSLTTEAINQFFTDLPATTKTATLRLQYHVGSATCDPTIATAKGYTVVT